MNLRVAVNSGLASLGLSGLAYSPGKGSDDASESLTYRVTAVPQANLGSILLADGTTEVLAATTYDLEQIRGMQFRPAPDGVGSGTFSFTVTDDGTTNGAADSKYLSQSLTVTVNASPVASNDQYPPITEDSSDRNFPSVLANDTDANGDALTAMLVGNSAYGILTLRPNGTFTYRPNPNFNGTDSFTYRASDGFAVSNLATVELTVTPVNDPPVLMVPGSQTVDEGQFLSFTVSASDVDRDTVRIVAAPPSGANFDAVTWTVIWTPNFDQSGSYVTQFTALDDKGGVNARTVSIRVNNVNRAPTSADAGQDKAVEADRPDGAFVRLSGAGVDPDGDLLAYAWSEDGVVVATEAAPLLPLQLGIHTLSLTVRDPFGAFATDAMTVTVQDTRPPSLFAVAPGPREATSAAGAIVDYALPTVEDVVDQSPEVHCDRPSGSIFPLGETVVTCIATDHAGNSDSISFPVTVRDMKPPVLANVPADFSVEVVGLNGRPVDYTLSTATDIVDPSPRVTCSPESGSRFSYGRTTVDCWAVDSSENRADTRSFRVTVRDSKGPTVIALNWMPDGKRRVSQISVAFSEDLSGPNSNAFALALQRGRGRSTPVPLHPVTYDPTNRTVTLIPLKPISRSKLPKTTIIISAFGLTDLSGNALDGDGDSNPGGDFQRLLSSGTFRV